MSNAIGNNDRNASDEHSYFANITFVSSIVITQDQGYLNLHLTQLISRLAWGMKPKFVEFYYRSTNLQLAFSDRY